MTPLVSVIVAIYNVAPFLKNCIDSIINQNLKDIEIILVDDGSVDGSSEICDDYAKFDDRIKVIHQINSGVSVARNTGIENSTSDWIIMVDGDDWLADNSIDNLYKKSLEESDSDIIIGTYYENYPDKEIFVGSDLPLETMYKYNMSKKRIEILSYVLEDVGLDELKAIKCNLSSPWAKLYRKSFLIENSILFVPKQVRAQDEVFNLYAFNCARNIVVVNIPVYHYRLWENSICRKLTSKKVPLSIYQMWHDQVKKFIDSFGYEEKLKDVYNLFVINLLTGVLKSYVNGYWNKELKFKETIEGLKSFSQEKTYNDVICNFGRNKYISSKIFLMSRLWKYKMYHILFVFCTIYRIRNRLFGKM